MTIFVLGLNHKTASIALREQVFFALEKIPLYLQDLLNRGLASEAVLLSTCNRSELYCKTDHVEPVIQWFCSQHGVLAETIKPAIYCYEAGNAVSHIMKVACGLDSMVLGESQILGQMKEAFTESCSAGAVSGLFHRLFQEIFAVAKAVRTNTAIGACPVSMASSAMYFAKRTLINWRSARVLVVGAGETSELLLRYLKSDGLQPAAIVNRNQEKAALLTAQFGGQPFAIDNLAEALSTADLVLTATGSAIPIITKAMLEQVMQVRKDQSLWIIDMAVPRDVEPTVADYANVHLYCIDDLKGIIEEHRRGREHAADKAHELIATKGQEFMWWLQSADTVANTIRAYREQIEAICQAELVKANRQLKQGECPHAVLENFARLVTNKLMHTPSVELRQAGAEGRFELLNLAKRLFALSDTEVEVS